MEYRLKLLQPWPDLKQVLTLSLPTPEIAADADASPELARIANNEMAAVRDRWPEKYPAFVASLPMNNLAAALEEMDRAVDKLGARGIQLITNINGRPLDDPAFFAVLERVSVYHDLPIWVHPSRSPATADYPSEPGSAFEIAQVLGWPHETSVAMARIVFSELFERLPSLRIITHHCGGTIPYLVGRVGPIWDEFGSRSGNPADVALRARMKQPPVDYFRRFYADTVLGGSVAALRCGIDFFGIDHIVFATDCPFGPESGEMFLRENVRAIDLLNLSSDDREKIYYKNTLRLLRLDAPSA
jgi:aminocarboxymuconate-semialdehyde decarboxylase